MQFDVNPNLHAVISFSPDSRSPKLCTGEISIESESLGETRLNLQRRQLYYFSERKCNSIFFMMYNYII